MSKRAFRFLTILLLLGFTGWSLVGTEFDLNGIYQGFFVKGFFWDFLAGMWPLNWGILQEVARETIVTIQIAWIGTLVAAPLSAALSFMAARTIAPSFGIGAVIRFLFSVDRSIDVLIVGLVMVSAVGLGPLAGTLAVAFHTIGALGKLFTEALESMDRGPIEALESVGANRWQVARWGVLPQVAPYLISYFLYRLELNIRSAVVLGFVGAGGIGYLLQESIRQFQYRDVSMILVAIVTLVMTIDLISAKLRKAVE